MEAWRQWRLGGRKPLSQKKTKIHLTPTGLLMEGEYTHWGGWPARVNEWNGDVSPLEAASLYASPNVRLADTRCDPCHWRYVLFRVAFCQPRSRLLEEQFPRLGCSTPVGDQGFSPNVFNGKAGVPGGAHAPAKTMVNATSVPGSSTGCSVAGSSEPG